ncbi:hypothetical protein FPV67DRAFT_1667149 [Lyophyllum atratum]|nr:hypothetical protein FPV67DRAFT_1667149 [Lyophyllum atratum]
MTAVTMAMTHDLRLPFPLTVYKSPSRTRYASSVPVTTPPPSPAASGSGHTSTDSSSRIHMNTPAPSIAMSLSKHSAESQRTSDTRHSCSDGNREQVPPPYTRSVEPPSYTRDAPPTEEPRTIPMYMFILGFVCPIFWLVGAFMMRGPHSHRRGAFDPYPSLSGAEKAATELEAERRKRLWEVEFKWAKRCMWATVLFVGVGLTVGMSVWGALMSAKGGKDG